ncbi:MAG: 5'/3'-nucleotidase SurE [Desulfococcaceae bacterium]
MMKILLTNDDGIYAPGLWALYREFSPGHSVTVVAPDRERSAVSHGITMLEPLRADKISVNGWHGIAVNGKPADCIKLGILEFMDRKPDLVLSGINPGANVGVSLNYSGTVAAAREAALYGIPAIAVSVQGFEIRHYDEAARFAAELACDVMEKGLPFGTALNVNMPDMPMKQIAGVRISRQGICRLSEEYYEKRTDPRNRIYHWLGADKRTYGQNPDVDEDALSLNYISITPIRCDMTDYGLLEEMKNWSSVGKIFQK